MVAVSEAWTMTANDRCDAKECGAQAYVKATGVAGELLFCNHHYERAVNNAVGYDKMMKFAFDITDERARLIENRLQGDD
jgi:hypothetical protein